jgi:hypothetical protein
MRIDMMISVLVSYQPPTPNVGDLESNLFATEPHYERPYFSLSPTSRVSTPENKA